MANTVQAKKRVRQAEVHRAHNTARRSMLHTYLKKVQKAIESKDKSASLLAYREVTSIIDRLTRKGLVHKNAAGRYKSKLNNRIRALS